MSHENPGPSNSDLPPTWPESTGWQPPALASPEPRAPRGHPVAAWIVIVMTVAGILILHYIEEARKPKSADAATDAVVMKLQGRYAVGARELMSGSGAPMLEQMEESLNQGSVDQRQRFIVLKAEMAGTQAAAEELAALDALVQQHGVELSETQQRVQQILHTMYDTGAETGAQSAPAPASAPANADTAPADMPPNLSALTQDDKDFLENQLGWFGRLALAAPQTGDQQQRQQILGNARIVAMLVVGIVCLLGLGGLLGFAGLIVLLVLLLLGRLETNWSARAGPHGIYAETFAIWLLGFFGLQHAAGLVNWHGHQLLASAGAFFASLLVLLWPVARGIPFAQVRRDIGWTLGRSPALEPVMGVAGYLMALPLLVVGVLLVLLLMAIEKQVGQALRSGVPNPFDPTTGPAHPIIHFVGGSGWMIAQVLLVASIAAPIVEETMFRGVLYRHLRSATPGWSVLGSIVFSTAVNTFIFAVIHPQGWVAIPALMSLATAFTLMREWRGSVIPSMIMHGISNGIVMLLLVVMVRG
jgi:membrane protease YdiL (CAAX protease family)